MPEANENMTDDIRFGYKVQRFFVNFINFPYPFIWVHGLRFYPRQKNRENEVLKIGNEKISRF